MHFGSKSDQFSILRPNWFAGLAGTAAAGGEGPRCSAAVVSRLNCFVGPGLAALLPRAEENIQWDNLQCTLQHIIGTIQLMCDPWPHKIKYNPYAIHKCTMKISSIEYWWKHATCPAFLIRTWATSYASPVLPLTLQHCSTAGWLQRCRAAGCWASCRGARHFIFMKILKWTNPSAAQREIWGAEELKSTAYKE